MLLLALFFLVITALRTKFGLELDDAILTRKFETDPFFGRYTDWGGTCALQRRRGGRYIAIHDDVPLAVRTQLEIDLREVGGGIANHACLARNNALTAFLIASSFACFDFIPEAVLALDALVPITLNGEFILAICSQHLRANSLPAVLCTRFAIRELFPTSIFAHLESIALVIAFRTVAPTSRRVVLALPKNFLVIFIRLRADARISRTVQILLLDPFIPDALRNHPSPP